MDSPKKAHFEQKARTESILGAIMDGTAKELAHKADDTDVAYLAEYEKEAMEYIKNGNKYMGISTGYQSVDNLLGSFLPGELLTIGGDTGHGKSIFAMNVAQNVYEKYQKSVLLVNLELTRNQAVQRFYSLSGDSHDYAGILIQKAPALKYSDIDVLMKKAKEHDCCLVVIDHLHFFSRSADNQARELSRITKHFKECAVENEMPVILLSHVTPTRVMDAVGRVKKVYKPGLHNLKGSSSIEQDSDMVAFVFRDEKHPNMIEFYMKKNRSRPLDQKPVSLIQDNWKIKEEISWVPNLPPNY